MSDLCAWLNGFHSLLQHERKILNLSRWDLEMWCICARGRCCVQIIASLRQIWNLKKGLVSFHCTLNFDSRLNRTYQGKAFTTCLKCWLFHSEPKYCISIHCGFKFLHWNGYCLSRGPQVGSHETQSHCCIWIDYLSLQALHPRSLYHLLSPISARYETGCYDRKGGRKTRNGRADLRITLYCTGAIPIGLIGGSESKISNSITYNP